MASTTDAENARRKSQNAGHRSIKRKLKALTPSYEEETITLTAPESTDTVQAVQKSHMPVAQEFFSQPFSKSPGVMLSRIHNGGHNQLTDSQKEVAEINLYLEKCSMTLGDYVNLKIFVEDGVHTDHMRAALDNQSTFDLMTKDRALDVGWKKSSKEVKKLLKSKGMLRAYGGGLVRTLGVVTRTVVIEETGQVLKDQKFLVIPSNPKLGINVVLGRTTLQTLGWPKVKHEESDYAA